jgi:hypothetical protein
VIFTNPCWTSRIVLAIASVLTIVLGRAGQRAGHEPTPLGGHADAATESQRGFADEGSAATLNVLLYLFSLVTQDNR